MADEPTGERVARLEAILPRIEQRLNDMDAKLDKALSRKVDRDDFETFVRTRFEPVERDVGYLKTRYGLFLGGAAVLAWLVANWERVRDFFLGGK